MDTRLIKKDKKNNKKNNIISSDIIFDILVVVCLVIFSIIISPKSLQNDTFYTIKCGEFIFNNGIGNLKSDPFSWLDLPYTFPHWLYDLMIYIIYAKFGWDGIYFSTILFASILGLTLYNLFLYKSGNRLVSGVIVFFAMYLLEPYIAARAQLVTYILFAVELLFIEKFLDNKKISYAVILIIIAALIAELHVAVFPMFFIFMLPAVGEFGMAFLLKIIAFIDIDFRKDIYMIILKVSKNEKRKEKYTAKLNKLKQNEAIRELRFNKIKDNPYKVITEKNMNVIFLGIVILICVFTGILNPTGDTAYTYLIKTYAGNTTSSINEHLPLTLADSPNFAIAICIFLLLLTFMDLKIKLRDLFMLIGVTIMAFLSRRQIALFVIGAAPILVKLLSDFFEKYDKETCKKLLKHCTAIYGIIIILGGFCYFGYDSYKDRKDEVYIYEKDYPVEASKWIKENLDVSKLKLYNEYNYGSYLIYENIPVFIDSRADLYAPEFNNVDGYKNAGDDIFSDALDLPSLSRGYEDIFKKYGVNHVILYSSAKLALLLNEDENYELLYDDNNFKIYERLNAENGK